MPTPPKEKHSEKKKGEIPLPPQPVPVAVQVVNGGTVQVPLRIYGKQEQETTFVIRKDPTLGKIVSLQPAGQEAWVLTYQHTPTKDAETSQRDHMLFAAQNKKGVSAAVEIVITIVDNPPELSAPGSVEFGRVAVGVPSSRVVTVANIGGGLLEGGVAVDPPWKIEPGEFKLRRGEKALLRLTLVPDAEREYGGYLHFLGENNLNSPLHATASVPFVVEPEAVELSGTSARSGDITLSNRTDTELTIQLEANPRLHLPAQVVLPPKKTQIVSATLAADDPWGIDDAIRVSHGTLSQQVRVRVAPTGPQLRADQTALEFEKVVSGTAKTIPIKLSNRGGTRASVKVQIPAPFRANSRSLTVEAGKSAELFVTLDADTPGPVSGSLNLTGVGSGVEIALRAEVLPHKVSNPSRLTVKSPSTSDVSPKTEAQPDVDPATLNAVITNATGPVQDLPGINGIELKHINAGAAEIVWPPLKGYGEVDYRVEGRRLSLDTNGILLQNWISVPGVQFSKKSDRITARVTGIPPGITVTARIVALSAGEPCAASLPLHFYVPAPTVFLTRRNTLLAGFGLLLAAGGFMKWRQKSRERGRN